MVLLIITVILAIVFFVWIMNTTANAAQKRKNKIAAEFRKENISKTNTRIENYLWIIKILKKYNYTIKEREGFNTTHLILSFQNPKGRTVILEQNNEDKNSPEQGVCFLKSGDSKIQVNRNSELEETPKIESWLKTIR